MARRLVRTAVVASLAACSDNPPTGPTLPPRFVFVVSEPVRFAFPASVQLGAGAVASLRQGDSVTWVALPARTVPGGRSAAIRSLTNGFAATANVMDGGFDPVPVPAGVGDSVEVVITDGSGAQITMALRVPRRRPPVVIRTVPPRGGTDVPLNSLIRVVFSEPMDRGTITTSTVRLLRNGSPVAGRVAVAADGLSADFVPDSLLARATSYGLVVETGAADLSGDALEQSAAVDFTTGRTAGILMSVVVSPDSAQVRLAGPDAFVRLTATLRDSTGAPLAGGTVTWTTSDSQVARVDSTGLVTGVGAGTATTTATINGLRGSSVITVLSQWSAAMVSPFNANLQVGEQLRLVATAWDSAGRRITGLRVQWWAGSAPVVLSTVSGDTAIVTATSAGAGSIETRWVAQGTGRILWSLTPTIAVLQSATKVASVSLTPDTVTAAPDLFRTGKPNPPLSLRVTLRDSNGTEILGAPVTLSSSSPGVAFVEGDVIDVPDVGGPAGRFARVISTGATGATTITATAGGRTARATMVFDHVTFAAVSVGGLSSYGSGGIRPNIANGLVCYLTPAGAAYCSSPTPYQGEGGNGLELGGYQAPVAVLGGHTFAQISSGEASVLDRHACGLTTDGAAYCWGDGRRGGLGAAGSQVISWKPVAVAGGLTFTQISAWYGSTCGLTTGGAAYCWGMNDYGQLGNGTTVSSPTPVAVVGGLTFAQISGTCALTTGGAAYCWGGSLRNSPVAVPGGLTFAQISGTCALTTGGAAYCWGGNNAMGIDTSGYSLSPVLIALPAGVTLTQIDVGTGPTCGIAGDGTAYCWGYYAEPLTDIHGVAGPTRVPGGLTFASVSSGNSQSCGVTRSSVVYCWDQITSIVGAPYRVPGQR